MNEEPNKGGRPEFEPTAEQRDQVEWGAYVGMTEVQLAAAHGIDPKTLRKHFADELLYGHSKKRMENIMLLVASAKANNVSAQKHLERMGAMTFGPVPAKSDQKPKTEELGKKAEAEIAARQPPPPDSKWSKLLQ